MDDALKAVVLDVDGTLTPQVSWLVLTQRLGASVAEHQQIYADYKLGAISYDEARERLVAIWRATGRANQQEFRQIFADLPIYPEAAKIVDYLRTKYAICLISGSMDMYTEIVALRLNIPEWHANARLEWDDHGELSLLHHERDEASLKQVQMEAFCRQHGILPTQCAAVGDGANEQKLFSTTKHGILVGDGGDAHLQQTSWRHVASLSDLFSVL